MHCLWSFLNHWYDDYPTLEYILFSAFKLTKNADINNCKYSGYGIGFDKRKTFSFLNCGFGCNVIFFEVDVSSSVHFEYNKRIDSW